MADPIVSKVRAGMIDMESNTTLVQCYPAHAAFPEEEGVFPGVLVLHDRFGLNTHTRVVTNRLAHAGFCAIAPDLYAAPTSVADSAPPSMWPMLPTYFDWSRESAARHRAAALPDDRALEIVERGFGYFAGRAKAIPRPIGVLGFGTGGRLALLAASVFPDEMRAAVCFYPDGLTARQAAGSSKSALDRLCFPTAPILIFYGLLDRTISPDEREAVSRKLQTLNARFRIESFPDAEHDFFCEERDCFRIHDSKVAWEETLAWLRDGGPGLAQREAG
jgi:carboxymethylenebutenolidase